MRRVLEHCAALDVHKKQLTACARVLGSGGELEELTVTFSTMAGDLLALRDWLKQLGVTHVAMEATGVYWSTTHSRTTSTYCWSTPSTSRTSLAARPTPPTRNGSANCWSVVCSGRASCRPSRSASCAT
jgi:hypothetical protein